MSREIVKSDWRPYYSRMARAYYVKVDTATYYFNSRKSADIFISSCQRVYASH